MKKQNRQMIVEVQEDNKKNLYILKVSKPLMSEFMKLTIEGGKRENVTIFFKLN